MDRRSVAALGRRIAALRSARRLAGELPGWGALLLSALCLLIGREAVRLGHDIAGEPGGDEEEGN